MSTPLSEHHRDAVARTRAPLTEARHLPGDFYTSTEIQTLERERIFACEWLCVARVEELEQPGDYITLNIAGEPILVCHADSGDLRAFFNVCRHRGTLVADGCGNRQSF